MSVKVPIYIVKKMNKVIFSQAQRLKDKLRKEIIRKWTVTIEQLIKAEWILENSTLLPPNNTISIMNIIFGFVN